MSKYFYNKYYEGEKDCWLHKEKRKVISIRLSDAEIEAVNKRYEGRDLSYGIRSLIHSHLEV